MTLDKDDLLRNAVPGYVFVAVVLSYYVFFDSVSFSVSIGSVGASLLTIVAGFPLGFIIQSIHRIVFHFAFGEQKSMEIEEADIGDPKIQEGLKQKVGDTLKNEAWSKQLAQWTAISLDRDENKHFKNRINFTNSYFHALGASSMAVIFGLLFVYTRFCLCICCQSYKVLAWFTAWVIMALIFWYGREKVRHEYVLCRKMFIRSGILAVTKRRVRNKKNVGGS